MKSTNCKINVFGQIVIALFLLSFSIPQSYAKAGCCADHGGVAGCNSNGYQQCKDGTTSPSCLCENSNAPVTKRATTTKKTMVTPVAPVKAKTTGCCRGHGGVASCDSVSGHQKCKDGSLSASCVCAAPTKAIKTKRAQLPATTTTTTSPTTKSIAAPKKSAKTAGCCRGHGGVASCDKATGYQKCKDGTMSPSCKCK